MNFVVVEFTEDRSVEVVPSNWLVDDSLCMWPPYRALRLTAAVKKREEPTLSWTRNPARILGRYGWLS